MNPGGGCFWFRGEWHWIARTACQEVQIPFAHEMRAKSMEEIDREVGELMREHGIEWRDAIELVLRPKLSMLRLRWVDDAPWGPALREVD